MEAAVAFLLQQLYPLVIEEVTSRSEVHIDFRDIKKELEGIQAFLRYADRRAGDGGGIKTWVKQQLREESFRIEDVIDDYVKFVAQTVNRSGYRASLRKIGHFSKTRKLRRHIVSEIRKIKASLQQINERRDKYNIPSENGASSSSGTNGNARFGDPRMASLFIKETEVVGSESPRRELVGCLVKGTKERMLVSVVGMAGLGKTTLAKLVFYNEQVTNHFDCRSFIIVSQSYTVKELLIDMMQKFCNTSDEPIPAGLHSMDGEVLVAAVRQYLQSKRYLVLFDDVWKENFCDEIEQAMINNDKGSRIIITTRMMAVAENFKRYFHDHVHVHKLQPLSPDNARVLFCKKAFGSKSQGQCPTGLEDIVDGLVEKCDGLPLAIVAIAGLFSKKDSTRPVWETEDSKLRMELGLNPHLNSLTTILSLSYDDLPHRLKLCMLYFGMYPTVYPIKCKRLTRQWMAEGFVEHEGSRTLEEVAEEYLTELIHRSLVQVSTAGCDGKVKSVQVHDFLRKVIIEKMKDLNFCHLMHEDDEQVTVGITRRFSITAVSNNVLRSMGNSGIHAVFVFDKGELSKYFMDRLSIKFKHLKVLDFENSLLNHVPSNLGKLFHLRYLNLSHTKVKVLPRSIGKLLNLETLDLRQTLVNVLPREIKKLTKLRLLPAYYRNYEGNYSPLNFTTGVKMQKGIGCLKSLQKLYFLEADNGVIQELKMLTQLRKLGIRSVRREYGVALCDAIQEMNHLQSLNIGAISLDEILDLDSILAPPQLRVLNLKAKLTRLPNWIPNLKYLKKLRLVSSNLGDDSLDPLKNLPELLLLNMWDDAVSGQSLHFQARGFPKLKELELSRLNRLSSITIDKGALLSLEHLRFNNNPQLTEVPQDLKHLKNLQLLEFVDMPAQMVKSINADQGGQYHSIINRIPCVHIGRMVGRRFLHDYELHTTPTLANA